MIGIRDSLEPLGDSERAVAMASYMKNQFQFLGVMTGPRRVAQRGFIKSLTDEPIENIWPATFELWTQPEREFQYVGMDLLRKNAQRLTATDLMKVRRLIETKPWWDTVDLLAAHVVGPIVLRFDLGKEMDSWIDDDNIWLARTAILHQLNYKLQTNPDRLFDYCIRRAPDTEFFIRKALGWALRQYARFDEAAVVRFVAEQDRILSGLTKREALKRVSKRLPSD